MHFLVSLLLAAGLPSPDGGNQVTVSTGVSAGRWVTLPDCVADGGNALNYNQATQAFACGRITDTTGSPGGNTTELQYNNSSAFGGIANVETDGTHLQRVCVNALPAPPSALATVTTVALQFDAGFPGIPFTLMAAGISGGVPMQAGLFSEFTELGLDAGMWRVQWDRVNTWNATASIAYGRPVGTGTALSAVAFSSASVPGRMPWAREGTSGSSAQSVNWRSGQTDVWRGSTGGAGGFLWWTRARLHLTVITGRTYFGLNSTLTAMGNVNPDTITDSVYFGQNADGGTMNVCANDASGNATCTDLGANFPARTNDAAYNMFLWAPPAASYIDYYIERLDVPLAASGRITSDLPTNTALLAWQNWMNNATTASAVQFDYGGTGIMGGY